MLDEGPATWIIVLAGCCYWLFLAVKAVEWQGQPWALKSLRLLGIPVVGVVGLSPGAVDRPLLLALLVAGLVLWGAGAIADGVWRSRNTP